MLDDKLKFTDTSVIFMGDYLEILINKIYEKRKLIEIGKTVKTIGILQFRLSNTDKYQAIFFPAIIEICPSEIYIEKHGDDEYVRMILYKGDILMKNKKVIRKEQLAYDVFSEFIENGRMPNFIPYDKRSFIFDTLTKVTGISFPLDHAGFEIILARLTRNAGDIFQEYRFVAGEADPLMLKLKDIAHATSSFSAKGIGGYLSDSINVMLTHENDENSDLEDILRK